MISFRTGSVGLCVFPEPDWNATRTVSYPAYVREILEHAGLCFSSVDLEDLSGALDKLGILVTVGQTELAPDLLENLRNWVSSGGAWISVGGLCGAGDVFGVELEHAAYPTSGGELCTLGEGYLLPVAHSHKILSHLEIPLHFFNGCAMKPQGAEVLASVIDAHQRPTGRAAVTENAFGTGRAIVIAPDVPGTVVLIQQGTAVTRDSVPSSDGTGGLCDYALKTGDGLVLDWIFDREPVPGAPGLQGFLQPIADQWRELLLRTIFYVAESHGVTLPLLWLYPRNLPALAHMSHDTDLSEVDKAYSMLGVLEQASINSTWCVINPVYPKEVIEAIKGAGHELATHYNTNPDADAWGEASFDSQWKTLVEAFGEHPVTNKNHYLRWEGDTEFFDWIAARGFRLDESKGPSKVGEVGFTFGSCQMYRPVDPAGNILDIWELPTLTQDLIVFAPPAVLDPLTRSVRKHHGIMHLLFHPAHIEKPGEAEIVLRSVETAREQGMEWWTGREIVDWFESRRCAKWNPESFDDDTASILISSSAVMDGATLLWLTQADMALRLDGDECTGVSVERWGFSFRSAVVDFSEGSSIRLDFARQGI